MRSDPSNESEINAPFELVASGDSDSRARPMFGVGENIFSGTGDRNLGMVNPEQRKPNCQEGLGVNSRVGWTWQKPIVITGAGPILP
jgi:hypothetical protein